MLFLTNLTILESCLCSLTHFARKIVIYFGGSYFTYIWIPANHHLHKCFRILKNMFKKNFWLGIFSR